MYGRVLCCMAIAVSFIVYKPGTGGGGGGGASVMIPGVPGSTSGPVVIS